MAALPTASGLGRRSHGSKEGVVGMIAVARSNDAVFLSFAQALLASAGIETLVLDWHASMMDGSIGAIPRRLCVADEDAVAALRLLREAGAGDFCLDDDTDDEPKARSTRFR
jgi:Putative prokaryotic signal transducing protein